MRSLFAGFLFLFAANLQAQDNGRLLIDIQQKATPKFHLNKTYNGTTPLEIKLSLYHLETSPIEISGFLSWGYPSSIDISYGLSAA